MDGGSIPPTRTTVSYVELSNTEYCVWESKAGAGVPCVRTTSEDLGRRGEVASTYEQNELVTRDRFFPTRT
ncbi:MAG: hypothetical protein RLZZ517_430 [Candidatus Parcubacteria bacterium]